MKSCVTQVYFNLFLSRNHGFKRPTLGNNKQLYFRDSGRKYQHHGFKRPTLGNNKQLYFRDSGRKYQHKDEGEILDFYLFLAKSIGLKSR